MKTLTICLALSLLASPTLPQSQSAPQLPQAQAPTQTLKAPPAFGLQDGTPVKLRIARTISSADAKTGETVDFEVLEDVKLGETIIVPRAGIAWATVTEAEPKRRMGRGGKLNVNIDSVRLVTGEKVALRAVKDMKGGGHVGAMTGAIVATSILFFPAAPLFLFMKGKDITIPKGTEITAYINGDIPLDPQKFQPVAATAAPTGATSMPASDADSSSILIKSTPDGAEILIDGKYAGNTPSTVRLKLGDHKISIKKAGFVPWERDITLNPGSTITMDASLEKTP